MKNLKPQPKQREACIARWRQPADHWRFETGHQGQQQHSEHARYVSLPPSSSAKNREKLTIASWNSTKEGRRAFVCPTLLIASAVDVVGVVLRTAC